MTFKKYLLLFFVFLLFSSFASAIQTDYYDFPNPLSVTTQSHWYGQDVTINTDNIYKVILEKAPSDASTGCQLTDSDLTNPTVFTSNTFSGNNCTLNYNLTNSVDYFFVITGSNRNVYYDGSNTWPIISNNGNFTLKSRVVSTDSGTTYNSYTSGALGSFTKITTYRNESTTPVVNELTESTTSIKQEGNILINNPALQTIISSNFVLQNTTNLYLTSTMALQSNNANTLYCELDLNGTVVANITRTNTANTLGTAKLMSELLTKPAGNYTETLSCSRSGGGQININNTVNIGHLLVNQFNESLPVNSTTFLSTVTSGSNFTLIDSFNLTTDPRNDTNKFHSLIIEGYLNYNNNHGTEEKLQAYAVINNTFNCPIVPRTVSPGGSGVVGFDCVWGNVSKNTTHQIDIYANGTNAIYEGNIIAKNFFLDDDEVVGGQGLIIGYTWNGTNDQLIVNVTGGNQNHDLTNVIVKVSESILTSTDTTVNFWVKIKNGTTYTTQNFTRDFEAGKIGNLVSQDVLKNLEKDDYQVLVYANCGGSNCTIVGGTTVGYLTDIVTTYANEFTIKAYDQYNLTQLQSFNITNGLTIITTNGTAKFFTTNLKESFNISAENYFTKEYENYSTINDLNASLTPYTKVLAYDYTNTTQVNNFTVTFKGVDYNTTNGVVYLPLFNETEEITISTTGSYATQTKNFTASPYLEEAVFYLYPFNSVFINIYYFDNLTLVNEKVDVVVIDSDGNSFINSTLTGQINFSLLEPLDYEFRFNATDYNTISKFIRVANDSSNNFSVYLTLINGTENQPIRVIDTSTNPCENCIVWLQKQVIGEDELYITVQEAQTDFDGRTTVRAEESIDEYYRFAVVFNDELRPILPNRNLFTVKTNFIRYLDETIQITIDKEDQPEDLIERFKSISILPYYTNNNQTFNIDYADALNTIDGARLEITGRLSNVTPIPEYEIISDQTLLQTSGTLSYTFLQINNTEYIINFYIINNGKETLYYEDTYNIDGSTPQEKNYGLFLTGLLGLMVGFGVLLKYGILPSVLAQIGIVFFMALFGFVTIPTIIVNSLIALAVIIFGRIIKR